LSTLADVLMKEEVASGLPIFMIGSAQEVLDATIPLADEIVMFLRMDFKLHSSNISGYVAFVLNIASIYRFKDSVNEYVRQCKRYEKKS